MAGNGLMANIQSNLENWTPGGGGSLTWSNAAAPTYAANSGNLSYCQVTSRSAPPASSDPINKPKRTMTTTTTEGDGGLTGLPPLTHTATPITDCIDQIKPTRWCNGSGGKSACVTSSYCSPLTTTADILCQINRGCKDVGCPQGQFAWCTAGHCRCRDEEIPEGQECLHSENCQSFRCAAGEEEPFCKRRGYCACRDRRLGITRVHELRLE